MVDTRQLVILENLACFWVDSRFPECRVRIAASIPREWPCELVSCVAFGKVRGSKGNF